MPVLITPDRSFEIDALLFDKDGTILPFDPLWTTWAGALHTSVAEAVAPIDIPSYALWAPHQEHNSVRDELHVATMTTVTTRVRDVLIDFGIDPSAASNAAERALIHADDAMETCRVTAFPGFLDLIAAGRRLGLPMAVVTGDNTDRAERQIKALGLDADMGTVIGGDENTPGKPQPDCLFLACERLGVDPARTAYVGDSLVDLHAARGAGAAAIAFASSDVDNLPTWIAQSDAVVRDYADVALVD